jgi:hypothetical protein
MSEEKLTEIYKDLNEAYTNAQIFLKAKEIKEEENELIKEETEKNNDILNLLDKAIKQFFENNENEEVKIVFGKLPDDLRDEIYNNNNNTAKRVVELFEKEKVKIIELASSIKAIRERNSELLSEIGKLKLENLKLEKLNNALITEHNILKRLDELNLD